MKSCTCYALRAVDCTCLPEKYDEIYTTPDQEPVAWVHTKIEGVVVPHRPADLDKHPNRWEALYKTPPPCPTCEALSRTVMLDQTSHDTTPQPKQEQGEPVAWLLTDKNINSLQVDSIQRLIDRLKHAHHTDLCVRINGQDEWFQADWLKHMVRATPPQRTEQNFCPRCGKRTKDIHTCTPPKD